MSEARITLSAVDKTAGAIASAKARLGTLSGEADALSTRFGGLGAAVAGALSLGGLGAMFNTIAGGLDKLNDLKDATGASIGNISALEDVAARAGTSFEVVGASLTKLNQALLTSKPGDDVANTLQAIGLQAEDLKRLDPAEALLQVAKGLDQFADDGNKARAAQTLFGRSLKDVAPLLKDLAEAGQLNATVTEEQAAAAERYANRLAASRKNLEDMGRAIVSSVLPVVEALQEAFTGAAGDADRFSTVSAVFRTVFETLAVLGANVAFVFNLVGREIGAIGAQIVALASRDLKGFNAISEAVKADAAAARKELDAFERRVMNVATATPADYSNEGRNRPARARLQVAQAPTAPMASAFDKYIERLRDSIQGTQDLTAVQRLGFDIAEGKLGKLTDSQRLYAVQLAATLDLARNPIPVPGNENLRDAARAASRNGEDIRALVDASNGAKFDNLVQQTQAVIGAFEAGNITSQSYARALETLGKEFESLQPKMEAASTFAEQAARNIQDTLGDTMLRVLEGNFSSIGKAWADTLRKMVAQAAAAQLNSALFGDSFGQKGGSLGGAVGELFKWFGSSFGGARAGGGPVQAGRPYLVGERGPELMVPRSSGAVVPNSALGGPQINYAPVFNVNGDVSPTTVAAIRNVARAEYTRLARQMSIQGAN